MTSIWNKTKEAIPTLFWDSLFSIFFVHPQGFEPWTHWLRVSCSTNWAKSAFRFSRGSWRIRTAVHGFADRWLSHSSKEPDCFDLSVSWRFLADSNRRTRFCRPLTKPLIQGTSLALLLFFSIALQRYNYFWNLQYLDAIFLFSFPNRCSALRPYCTRNIRSHSLLLKNFFFWKILENVSLHTRCRETK